MGITNISPKNPNYMVLAPCNYFKQKCNCSHCATNITFEYLNTKYFQYFSVF